MLIRLLRMQLAKYRWPLLVVAILQLIQTIAVLYLPNLSADVIDRGIAKHDSGYIWKTGLLMLGVSGFFPQLG